MVDVRHGYALTEHDGAPEAEQHALLLATDPEAAAAAVRALDAAQTGPAAAVRRTLRRYGYHWTLRQSELNTLCPPTADLDQLLADGHLKMVWDLRGLPFYCTPELYTELEITWLIDGDEQVPAAPRTHLARPRPARDRLSSRTRRQPCELHGIATANCMLCGPREAYECQWGDCTANALTTVCESHLTIHTLTTAYAHHRRQPAPHPAANA